MGWPRRPSAREHQLTGDHKPDEDMTGTSSRPFIAAMQVTLDGYILGPEGEADWVDSWADGLDFLPPIDALPLGGGMFPDYERFCCAEA
jgi:hypothetical protein